MPMDKTIFYAMAQAVLIQCLEVMTTKGEDYTKQSDNKLANFERQAERNGLPPQKIIDIYAQKHQDAIDSYRLNGAVESEPLEMRFVDRINYLLLELAQDIATGYVPREEWLIEALGPGQVEAEREAKVLPFVEEVAEDAQEEPTEEQPALPPTVADEDAEGEPCCGVPGHKECCEEAPAPPPPEEKKRERGERQRQRRPARPKRTPRGSEGFETDEDNVPIAKPDKRFDPDALRERGRTDLTE